jgi:succinoglycan biosynthesis transport protein ExoP
MEREEFIKNKSPLEYLKVFFRRKWLFVTPIFASLVLGIVACFLLPPVYESSTAILIEEEKIINPLIQNLAVSTAAAQRMQSIKEVILGWNSLVELTRKLGLAKDVQSQLQFEGLIKDLRDTISVQMRQPNIIRISYFNRNPKQAQLITQTLSDILIAKNMESQTKETDVAIEFIKEQLAIYKNGRRIKESFG